MNHPLVARLALSGLCLTQGAAQLLIDLNRTHASNPDWTGHARFHVVWQSITVAVLSGTATTLIWSSWTTEVVGFYTAVVLINISPVGFLFALLSRKIYGGTLNDPSGIAPAELALRGKMLRVDLNLVAVLVSFAAVACIVGIYRW